VVVDVLVVGAIAASTVGRSRRRRVLKTPRMGSTTRCSTTRFLRSWNDLRWTAWIWGAAFVEEQVFEFLDAFVKLLYGGEVAVDEVVGQAVEQAPDAVAGEVGCGVPAGEHRGDVELVVLAYRDERLVGDEHRDLAGLQRRAFGSTVTA
jgi:hypothetical protein